MQETKFCHFRKCGRAYVIEYYIVVVKVIFDCRVWRSIRRPRGIVRRIQGYFYGRPHLSECRLAAGLGFSHYFLCRDLGTFMDLFDLDGAVRAAIQFLFTLDNCRW